MARPGRRAAVVAKGLVAAVGIAAVAAMFVLLVSRSSPWQINSDSLTYLAAGERLNAGHNLYSLLPSDRQLGGPGAVPEAVPLLSPPLIAVLWRPLAALPADIGALLWWVGSFIAVSATLVVVLWRLGLPAALAVVVLSWSLAIELITGNVNGFLTAGAVLAWLYRDRPWVGAIVGVMAALKLGPVILFLFLAGQRNWRALQVGAATLVVCLVIGLLGAGLQAHLDYIGVALGLAPQAWSLSVLTGVSWMTTAVLVGGSALCLASADQPGVSYRLAVLTMIFGSPAVSGGTLAMLVTLLAPWLPPRRPEESAVAHRPSTGTIDPPPRPKGAV